jgi:hypothetical protein
MLQVARLVSQGICSSQPSFRVGLLTGLSAHPTRPLRVRPTWSQQLVRAAFFGVQFTVAYLLMLIGGSPQFFVPSTTLTSLTHSHVLQWIHADGKLHIGIVHCRVVNEIDRLSVLAVSLGMLSSRQIRLANSTTKAEHPAVKALRASTILL